MKIKIKKDVTASMPNEEKTYKLNEGETSEVPDELGEKLIEGEYAEEVGETPDITVEAEDSESQESESEESDLKVTKMDIDTGEGNPDFQLPNIADRIGEEILMKDVRFEEGPRGEYAIVTLKDDSEYQVGSKILRRQLSENKEKIQKEGQAMKATIDQRRGSDSGYTYYTFA